MSAYPKKRISTYPTKKDVNIPQNKDVDIPSKNNNQSSVNVKFPRNKVSNQLFNSDTVKYHVSTNNKDVSIPQKKDVDIPNKKDVNIPQNKDVDIPSKNNNQSSVNVKVSFNKLFNQLFNNVRYRNSMSTYYDGCQHTMFCMMSVYHIFNIITQCQHIMLYINIPYLV